MILGIIHAKLGLTGILGSKHGCGFAEPSFFKK